MLLSRRALTSGYAREFVRLAPAGLRGQMQQRIERYISAHPDRTNHYLQRLLVAELPTVEPHRPGERIELDVSDVASFLENQPPGSFDAFTLSSILDGATATYRECVFRAVEKAANRDAVIVLRSFREAPRPSPYDRRGEDRPIFWRRVEVLPVCELDALRGLFDD